MPKSKRYGGGPRPVIPRRGFGARDATRAARLAVAMETARGRAGCARRVTLETGPRGWLATNMRRPAVVYSECGTERQAIMTEFGRKSYRWVWIGALATVLLVAGLLLSPVRSVAVGALDSFRVKRFAVITVDPSKLPFAQAARVHHGAGLTPNPDIFGDYNGPLKPQKPVEVGTLEAAAKRTGESLADAGGTISGRKLSAVYVGQAAQASYTFDLAKMRAAVQRSGVKSVTVPAQLDGKTFTLQVPQGVFVRYGTGKDSVVFAQGNSPTLRIPDGVNMEYIRQDILSIPGLPPDLASQLQQVKDWEHTLIIPLPPGGSSKDVKVDGAPGVQISDRTGEYNAVLWQRNGRLYAVGGKLSAAQALDAASAVVYP